MNEHRPQFVKSVLIKYTIDIDTSSPFPRLLIGTCLVRDVDNETLSAMRHDADELVVENYS